MNQSMQMQEYVEVRDSICYFRPQGECSLIDAVELIKGAIAYCRGRGVDKLLFNATGLVGVAVPSLCDRFLMIEELAPEVKGAVVMALVVRPEYIHPEKFGVRLASDLGLVAEIYSSETDAVNWLSSGVGPA
jgi:hypothetical protein